MLIVEENSVYEIDEECIRTRKVSPQCKTYEKMLHITDEAASDKKQQTP